MPADVLLKRKATKNEVERRRMENTGAKVLTLGTYPPETHPYKAPRLIADHVVILQGPLSGNAV